MGDKTVEILGKACGGGCHIGTSEGCGYSRNGERMAGRYVVVEGGRAVDAWETMEDASAAVVDDHDAQPMVETYIEEAVCIVEETEVAGKTKHLAFGSEAVSCGHRKGTFDTVGATVAEGKRCKTLGSDVSLAPSYGRAIGKEQRFERLFVRVVVEAIGRKMSCQGIGVCSRDALFVIEHLHQQGENRPRRCAELIGKMAKGVGQGVVRVYTKYWGLTLAKPDFKLLSDESTTEIQDKIGERERFRSFATRCNW